MRILFTIFLFFMVNSIASDGGRVIRIGLWDYPPYMQNYETEKTHGYCYELVSRVLASAGYRVVPYFAPSAALAKQAKAKRVEGICVLPKSYPNYHYSQKDLVRFKWKLWMRKDFSFSFSGIDSYKNIRVVTLENWNYRQGLPLYQKAIEGNPKTFVIKGRNGAKRALQLVDSGRADIFALDDSHANFLFKRHKFQNEIKSLEVESGLQSANFAIRKDFENSEKIIQDFDKHYRIALKNGLVKRLRKKYEVQDLLDQ